VGFALDLTTSRPLDLSTGRAHATPDSPRKLGTAARSVDNCYSSASYPVQELILVNSEGVRQGAAELTALNDSHKIHGAVQQELLQIVTIGMVRCKKAPPGLPGD
jgi:hypothetical protein